MNNYALPGSEFVKLKGYTNPTPASTKTNTTFAFYLRTGNPLPDVDQFNRPRPNQRKYLSRKEYKHQYSVSSSDLGKIKKFAKANGLQYEQANLISGQVLLTATLGVWQKVFSVNFIKFNYIMRDFQTSVMGHDGPFMLPESLKGIVLAIGQYGLTTQAKKMVIEPAFDEPSCQKDTHLATEMGKLYNFPENEKGKGQTIGILEFPGDYLDSDLKLYYDKIGLKNPPNISRVSLNNYQPPKSIKGLPSAIETSLDIQVATPLASEANFVIYLQAGLGEAYIYDGIFNALFDENHTVDVLSISYGQCELMTPAMITGLFDRAMQIASLMGVTVCVASGDGASPTRWVNALGGNMVSVDIPAACTYALACGGTYTASENGKITEETVWNDLNIARQGSGGGFSMFLHKPAYQLNTPMPDNANCSEKGQGRGMPDVASNASSETAYQLIINGQEKVYAGTSSAAPLWAALIAICNSALGYNLGFVNNLLYEDLKGEGCVSIVNGNNGAYQASEGWDACTGWGRPDGTALLNAFKRLMD